MSDPFEVWTHALSIWKTKSAYFVWLRGHLRRIWADNPLRTEWKKTKLRPVTREERLAKIFHPSTKTVGQCYLCHEWFSASKLECDHIVESEGCYDFNTAEKFLWHCAANDPSNWALACKSCHKHKSYSIAQGISFEEAVVQRKAIELIKTKQDKAFLESKGIKPESSEAKRRKQIVEYLTKEGEKND